MKSTKKEQWRRIVEAMLNGKEVNRAWASKQSPIIAQTGNRCNELRKKMPGIEKLIVYPEGRPRYVTFWMTPTTIQLYKSKLS